MKPYLVTLAMGESDKLQIARFRIYGVRFKEFETNSVPSTTKGNLLRTS